MNTVTTVVAVATDQQIKANVARWRREHGLDPKPAPRRFVNAPTFVHKGDRVSQIARGK